MLSRWAQLFHGLQCRLLRSGRDDEDYDDDNYDNNDYDHNTGMHPMQYSLLETLTAQSTSSQ